MVYEVVALDKYQEDLRSILIYLVDILDAPSAAASLMDAVDLMIARLEEFPSIKAISTKATLAEHELREYLVRNYVVLYRIEGQTVYLEHMFHASQNYEAYV